VKAKKVKSQKMLLNIPKDVHTAFKKAVSANGTNMQEAIIKFMKQYSEKAHVDWSEVKNELEAINTDFRLWTLESDMQYLKERVSTLEKKMKGKK
jgi:uncharacterized protein YpuA (DUF1002 family)